MTFALKKTPPNPNGNPNFRKQWERLGETSPVKFPKELHALFKDLATAINSGSISVTQLKSLCNGENPQTDILPILEKFEDEQRASWGQGVNQRGEFKPTSRSWDKFNEFKQWIKEHN